MAEGVETCRGMGGRRVEGQMEGPYTIRQGTN